ncbi:MAG: hypothetical protein ACXW13_00060 [Burkholderiaceae bacterium]
MSSNLFFALLAFHGGAVYQIDSGLSAEDCATLSAPGSIAFMEAIPGKVIRPDATTRFVCEPQGESIAIHHPHAPETNPRFENGFGDTEPRLTAYGSGRMSNKTFRELHKAIDGMERNRLRAEKQGNAERAAQIRADQFSAAERNRAIERYEQRAEQRAERLSREERDARRERRERRERD